jgi:hypothetical protein
MKFLRNPILVVAAIALSVIAAWTSISIGARRSNDGALDTTKIISGVALRSPLLCGGAEDGIGAVFKGSGVELPHTKANI